MIIPNSAYRNVIFERKTVISNDIDESSNLATRRPEDAKRLLAMLDTYLLEIGAELPLQNPKFDPSKLPDEGRSKGSKKGKGRKGDK